MFQINNHKYSKHFWALLDFSGHKTPFTFPTMNNTTVCTEHGLLARRHKGSCFSCNTHIFGLPETPRSQSSMQFWLRLFSWAENLGVEPALVRMIFFPQGIVCNFYIILKRHYVKFSLVLVTFAIFSTLIVLVEMPTGILSILSCFHSKDYFRGSQGKLPW